jgi:hypothetical protein
MLIGDMRGTIVLQDMKSARYLAADGDWVTNPGEARQFEHTWAALLEGLAHRGKQLQVLWSLPGPAEHIRIPVGPGAAPARSAGGVSGRLDDRQLRHRSAISPD